MSGWATCPACKGSGVVTVGDSKCACCDSWIDETCSLCRGSGEVRADVAVDWQEQQVTS